MKKMERELFERLCLAAGKPIEEAIRCVAATDGVMIVVDDSHPDYPVKTRIRRCCGEDAGRQ